MAQWLHAEYRDFCDYPRMMVCTGDEGTFLFLSRFDETADEYLDYYEVYRIHPVTESAACLSWYGLETQALARLPNLPVREFPFDIRERRFLAYDPIIRFLQEDDSRGG